MNLAAQSFGRKWKTVTAAYVASWKPQETCGKYEETTSGKTEELKEVCISKL